MKKHELQRVTELLPLSVGKPEVIILARSPFHLVLAGHRF